MSRRILVLLLMVFGLLAGAGAAEKEPPLPKAMPAYGPLQPIAAPTVREQKLSNGMTLWLVPRPGFPKVAFALAVRGGMASDPKALPGLSDLLVATIDQGTKTRSAKQIAEEIQAAGGDLFGNAEADSIVISASVLSSKADSALALLADVFENATFPDGEVDLAKRNAAEELRAEEAEPSFLARRALAKALFGQHPYAVISGTEESIARTAPADLRGEYARRFRPDQTLLVAVGDFDLTRLAATIQKLFGNWAAPQESPVPPVPAAPQSTPHAIFYVERAGSVQTTLALAALGPTEDKPDFAAAQVANAIYGGMFGSRLMNNIREDKGYTYSPRAFLEARRLTGILETRADVRNAVTGASFNEISYELNRMATTSPSQEEVERAQRYLVGTRAISLQAESSVAHHLASLWTRGLPAEELGRESEKIREVTAKDAEAVGERYFPASRQTVVAVGEEKVLQQQLAPFGIKIEPAPQASPAAP
jgi:zinc protease